MKVKIEKWYDLHVGDRWLGMEVEERNSSGMTFRRADREPMLGASAIDVSQFPIDVLIAAGNDTVERKPNSVEFEATVGMTTCYTGYVIATDRLRSFDGQRVKVTIEPA